MSPPWVSPWGWPWSWVGLAYLAGSIPFGLLVGRARGVDVRAIGSGNIGATNVARAAGKTAAAVTLVLDSLKGGGPAWLAACAGGPAAGAACGVAAVIGHCFPIWLRLRGGKGVATGLGVALALCPPAALAAGAAWGALYWRWRISSVGSLAAVVVALVIAGFVAEPPVPGALAVIALLVLVRHGSNLARLWRREER